MNFTLKMTAASAALLLALGLSGCTEKAPQTASSVENAAAASDALSAIRAKGQITIAMEGTWAPWTFHDASGTLTGYDVAVGRGIAKAIGVEPVFVEGKWDGLLAGISAGRYDLMVNGVDVTPERADAFRFSEPYAYNRMAVIVKDDRSDIQTMADLKGKHTANTISSTYAIAAEKAGARVTGVDDLNQTFELLLSGRIDATLNSEVTFYDYKRAHPEAKVKIAFLAPAATAVAIPMKKDASTETLAEAVNDAIRAMRESGELARASTEFFGGDISKMSEEKH